MDVTISKQHQILANMAEAAKSVFNERTMVPIGFAFMIMGMISGGIAGYVTMQNKVEMLTATVEELKDEQDKFMTVELGQIQLNQIKSDLIEIKDLLKNKQ